MSAAAVMVKSRSGETSLESVRPEAETSDPGFYTYIDMLNRYSQDIVVVIHTEHLFDDPQDRIVNLKQEIAELKDRIVELKGQIDDLEQQLDQSYFWTDEWQAAERQVDEEVAAGQYKDFATMDDFLADLMSDDE